MYSSCSRAHDVHAALSSLSSLLVVRWEQKNGTRAALCTFDEVREHPRPRRLPHLHHTRLYFLRCWLFVRSVVRFWLRVRRFCYWCRCSTLPPVAKAAHFATSSKSGAHAAKSVRQNAAFATVRRAYPVGVRVRTAVDADYGCEHCETQHLGSHALECRSGGKQQRSEVYIRRVAPRRPHDTA